MALSLKTSCETADEKTYRVSMFKILLAMPIVALSLIAYARIEHVVKIFICSVVCVQCLPFHFVFLLWFLCYCAIYFCE